MKFFLASAGMGSLSVVKHRINPTVVCPTSTSVNNKKNLNINNIDRKYLDSHWLRAVQFKVSIPPTGFL